jgi:hypothetical protein
VIQNCALATTPSSEEASLACVGLLVKVLTHPGVGTQVPTMALAGVASSLALLGEDTKVMDPHMDSLLKFSASHALQVVALTFDF